LFFFFSETRKKEANKIYFFFIKRVGIKWVMANIAFTTYSR